MGKKGDKMTSGASEEAEAVVGLLSELGEISSKKMFGGFGLFEAGKMFGIIDSSGRLFFKADDSNMASFVEAGSEKHGRMPYFSVPDSVRGDDAEFRRWGKSSIKVANG